MDPELQRALNQLAAARVAARKDGVSFSPEEEEAFLREETQGKFGMADIGNDSATNAVLAMGQGALFNWVDELAGMFSPALGEKLRIRGEAFRRQQPKSAFAHEIAGGILVPGLGTANAARLVGTGAKAGIAAGALAGAGSGALAGAGAAGPGHRVAGAVTGGAGGAVVGGGLSAIAGAARHFLSPEMKAQALRKQLVEGAGGADVIRNRAAQLSQASADVTAADAAPTLRGQAENMLSNFPALHTDVQERIAARQAVANERVAARFAAIRPNEVPAERLARMRANTKAWAASSEGFEGLRQMYPELPEAQPFVDYFNQPHIRDLWSRAEQQGLVGVNLPLAGHFNMQGSGHFATRGQFVGSPSFAQIHDLIQGLDKAITAKFKTPGQQQIAAQLVEVSDFLKAELGAQVPEAAPVFAEYASRMARERGLDLGRKMFSATPNKFPDLAVAMRKLPQEAQDEVRLALAGELMRKMRTVSSRKSYASLVKSDPALQEKFAFAFGDQAGFSEFIRTAGLEDELNKLREITANSRSAMRLAGRDDKGVLETMGEALPSGSVLAAGVRVPRAGARAAIRGSQKKAERTVVEELLAPGMSGVDAFLKAASTRTPTVPRRVQAFVPSIASATAERIKELFQR